GKIDETNRYGWAMAQPSTANRISPSDAMTSRDERPTVDSGSNDNSPLLSPTARRLTSAADAMSVRAMTKRSAVVAREMVLMPSDPSPLQRAQSSSTTAMSGQLRWLFVKMTLPSPASGTA